jgi:hypothetical protein
VQIVALDWSGELLNGGKTKIWSAHSAHGHLDLLQNGRPRPEIADHLIQLADEDPDLLVGLDFAFSMPEWFVQETGASDGREFWDIAASDGEGWLKSDQSPFFGRHKGSKAPPEELLFRQTELDNTSPGNAPKSVFQVGGGGAVGTGSIRGMPLLSRLTEAGFRVWPFDDYLPGTPLVVEIYPRLLTGAVVKSSAEARADYLRNFETRIGHPDLLASAASGEDAFDAAVSAMIMNRFLHDLVALPLSDAVDKIEGRIWKPLDGSFLPGSGYPRFLDPLIPKEPFAIRWEGPPEITDGPFQPDLTQVMEDDQGCSDGTVGVATAGSALYLRVTARDGNRLFTADGEWLELIPESRIGS